MNENAQATLDEMRARTKATVSATKDLVCENCVWPFRETDQEAMSERCDTCAVAAALDKMGKAMYATGYAAAMAESLDALLQSIDRVQEQQHAEMLAKVHPTQTGGATE